MYNFSCKLLSVSFVQCSKASSVVVPLTGLLSWAWDLRASDYAIGEGVRVSRRPVGGPERSLQVCDLKGEARAIPLKLANVDLALSSELF